MWFSRFGLLQSHNPLFSPGAQCETTNKADIVVLVDGSGSISQEGFETIQIFIADIVNAFDIGPDRFQIGNSFTTANCCVFVFMLNSFNLVIKE